MQRDLIHVLVVPGHPTDAQQLQQLLEQAQRPSKRLPRFAVTHAPSLPAALAHLERQSCDVALIALDLPGGQGPELVTSLRARFPHLPLVALTPSEGEFVPHGVQDSLRKHEVTGNLLSRVLLHAVERAILQRAQDNLQTLLYNTPHALVLLNPSGMIQAFNPAAARHAAAFGGQRLQSGHSAYEYLPPSVRETFSHHFRAAVRGETATVQTDFNGNGWYSLTFAPIQSRSNTVTNVCVTVTDITACKRTERSLRVSQAKLARAQRIAHLGNWEWDLEGQTLTWSDELYHIFGLEPEAELTYESIESLIHPDDRAKNAAFVQTLLTTAHSKEMEFRILRSQGEMRHLYQSAEVRRDEEGRVRKMFGIMQDITKRKRAEAALEQYVERLQIQHDIDTAILAAHSPHEIASAALERLHHLIPCRHATISEIDANQRRARDLVVSVEGKLQAKNLTWYPLTNAGQPMIEHIRRGQSYQVVDLAAREHLTFLEGMLLANGMRAYVTVPLRVQGTPVGTLNLASEAPDFFQPDHLEILEELGASLAVALQQARLLEQTQQDAKAKALLLREVNHRVKNNLDAIIGLLYVERRHAPPEALPAYRPIMDDLTQRIAGLAQVHRMLSEAEWGPLNLSYLAEQIVHTAVGSAKDHQRITLDVSPSEVWVQPAQAQHLALILSELATNTLKHSADREAVRIRVHVTQEGDEVTLTFRNDGPDYPEDVLSLERHGAGLDIVKCSVRENLRGELVLHNDHGPVTEITFSSEA